MTENTHKLSPLRLLLVRAVWLAMFALHAFWLVRAVVAAGAVSGSHVFLAAAVVVFALRAADLPALRLNCSRRAIVAGMLVVGLLHVGVIDRAITGEADTSPWVLPAVAVTGAFVARERFALIVQWLSCLASSFGGGLPVRSHEYRRLILVVFARWHQQFLGAVSPPRAPPF